MPIQIKERQAITNYPYSDIATVCWEGPAINLFSEYFSRFVLQENIQFSCLVKYIYFNLKKKVSDVLRTSFFEVRAYVFIKKNTKLKDPISGLVISLQVIIKINVFWAFHKTKTYLKLIKTKPLTQSYLYRMYNMILISYSLISQRISCIQNHTINIIRSLDSWSYSVFIVKYLRIILSFRS